jgi:hypothetical protein
MIMQAGYPLPVYPFEGRGARASRQRYLGAIQRGYVQDYDDLRAFFEDAIRAGLDLETP